MSIILRNVKGSPLTYNELDSNFIELSQSYATTGSNLFNGNQTIIGNLSVFGSASFTFTTSSVTTISASEFSITISSPSIRYGFYNVLDTGSISTSSFAWDSNNKYWIYRNVTGSVTSSAILLTGPVGTGGLGTEASIPQYRIPTSNGNQSLISSNIYSSGSTHIITGSLNVTGGITGSLSGSLLGTASFASTASYVLNAVSASYVLNAINASTASYVLNAVSASYILNAISSSFASTASYVLNAVSASYVLNAISSSFTLTAVSSSFALSSSFASSSSISVSSSFASTASYVLNAVSSSQAISSSFALNSTLFNNRTSTTFANTGSNNFIGIQNITGSLIVTGSLIRSGSSTFKNIGVAEMTGSLLVNTLNGRRLFIASSSLSSSISSSNEPTTATFNGSTNVTFNAGASAFDWDSNFDVYYSGVSGSGETEVSPVYNAIQDGGSYNDVTMSVSPRPQITLSPSGSIQSYKLYVYNYPNATWYVKSAISEVTLDTGVNFTLTGKTSTNFGTDLVNRGGFNTTSSAPTSNINTITYVSQSIVSFTSSLVDINAPTTITGSLNVSGSILFVGTHTLSGSNTIIGNTVLSGSIIVSGSTTFRNTIFTVTGSQFFTGSSVHIGNQTITGSLNLTSNGIGTGLFINGQKQFNYIALSHTASILPTQNVSGSFIYSTTEHSSGISVVSGSRITFANTGTYNIQFSAQLYAPTNNTNVYIWFKKNGTNIANSATQIDIGSADYGVAAWNYVDTFTSGSYAEIAYQTDQTTTQFQYAAATGNIPAIPSIIATVTQIA